MTRTQRSLLATLLLVACARTPEDTPAPAPQPPASPSATPNDAPTEPCVAACGTPERPCRLTREPVPDSDRPVTPPHFALDPAGYVVAAFDVFVGEDPLTSTTEGRIAVRDLQGHWHVQRAPFQSVAGLALEPGGHVVVHDSGFVAGQRGGGLLRAEDGVTRLASDAALEWRAYGPRHNELTAYFSSLERAPDGSFATVFEYPFSFGRFDEAAGWRTARVGDFIQLQSPHVAVDAGNRAHAFVAYTGRYDEPFWISPPDPGERAPVAGPFSVVGAGEGLTVHVVGRRCTAQPGVCYGDVELPGWELVYARRQAGEWDTPLVAPNFSTDPENVCGNCRLSCPPECAEVESEELRPLAVVHDGCGRMRLVVRRLWTRPTCAQLPEGATACAGARLELVTFGAQGEARFSAADGDVPFTRRMLASRDGVLHAVVDTPDRQAVEYVRLVPAR
ncbi:MAG: hypothetical protein ACK4N5_00185 [Myxococcales bacterium]